MVVRDLVAQFGGTLVELRGDEALCVFSSPRQSLRLACCASATVRRRDPASAEVTHLAGTITDLQYVVLEDVALKGLSDRVRPVRVCPQGEDPARQIAALLASATVPGMVRPPPRWLPGWLAARPRTTVALAVVVAAVVAATLVSAIARDGATRLKTLSENAVGILDPPLNQNPAEFCDPSIDRLISQATQLQSSSRAAANDLWAQVDRRLVDAAPVIPLVNPSWVDVVSTRVHHYERSPVLGVLFDQMRVH